MIRVVALAIFSVFFFATPSTAATIVDRSGAHPSWSKAELTDFKNTVDGTVIGAAKRLQAAGWLGNWTAGKTQYDAKKETHLYLGTKAAVKHADHTRGKPTGMFISFWRLKDGQNTAEKIDNVENHYGNIARLSDKYRSYRLANEENLGFGEYSRVFTVESRNKTSGTARAKTIAAGFVVDGNWIIQIEKATNPVAVKAVIVALHQSFSNGGAVGDGRQSNSGTEIARDDEPAGRQGSDRPRPSRTDTGTQSANVSGLGDTSAKTPSIGDRMADPTGGQLKDFEQFFYRIDIPSDKSLIMYETPSTSAPEVIRLLPGANDLQVNRLRQAEGRVWANLCASSQCGWSIANYLRRDKKRSEAGFGFVEVAYPEVNLFTEPTVESPLIGVLKQGEKYKPDLVETDKEGIDWIRICGSNWCGWAAREYFVIN